MTDNYQKNRYFTKLILLYIIISMIFIGCSSKTTEKPKDSTTKIEDSQKSSKKEEIVTGGTLKVLMQSDPACLGYTGKLQSQTDYFMAQPALEPLGRYDETGILKPFLAEKFESDFSTLTATITIKKDIKFHDGTPLNAEAVIWNWKEYTSSGKNELNSVDKYEKIDEFTIKIYLKKWDNAIIDNLAFYGGFMISPTSFEKNGKDWTIMNPVGTGPFKLINREQGVKVVYEKNKDYWISGQPFLDGIEFKIIKDQTTRAKALKDKEADVLIDPGDFKLVEDLKKSNLKLVSRITGMGSVIYGFMPNSADIKSPFYKLEVRQALQYAIDGKSINKTMTLDNGIYTNQWASPTSWSYNKDVVGYPYNPEKAKELLSKAGYPNGFETTIFTDNQQSSIQRCNVLQGYLKEVGINTKIESMERAKYDELNGKNGTWDGIALWSSRADPDISVTYPRVLSKNGSRFVNGSPHPKELEDIMITAQMAPTFEEKMKICKQMSKMLIDDYAYILPIFITSPAIFTQDNVKDTNLGWNYYSLWSPETAKIVK